MYLPSLILFYTLACALFRGAQFIKTLREHPRRPLFFSSPGAARKATAAPFFISQRISLRLLHREREKRIVETKHDRVVNPIASFKALRCTATDID